MLWVVEGSYDVWADQKYIQQQVSATLLLSQRSTCNFAFCSMQVKKRHGLRTCAFLSHHPCTRKYRPPTFAGSCTVCTLCKETKDKFARLSICILQAKAASDLALVHCGLPILPSSSEYNVLSCSSRKPTCLTMMDLASIKEGHHSPRTSTLAILYIHGAPSWQSMLALPWR